MLLDHRGLASTQGPELSCGRCVLSAAFLLPGLSQKLLHSRTVKEMLGLLLNTIPVPQDKSRLASKPCARQLDSLEKVALWNLFPRSQTKMVTEHGADRQ